MRSIPRKTENEDKRVRKNRPRGRGYGGRSRSRGDGARSGSREQNDNTQSSSQTRSSASRDRSHNFGGVSLQGLQQGVVGTFNNTVHHHYDSGLSLPDIVNQLAIPFYLKPGGVPFIHSSKIDIGGMVFKLSVRLPPGTLTTSENPVKSQPPPEAGPEPGPSSRFQPQRPFQVPAPPPPPMRSNSSPPFHLSPGKHDAHPAHANIKTSSSTDIRKSGNGNRRRKVKGEGSGGSPASAGGRISRSGGIQKNKSSLKLTIEDDGTVLNSSRRKIKPP